MVSHSIITVKKYLQEEPRARERKNKNRAILNIVAKKYGLQFDEQGSLELKISKDRMADLVSDVLTFDRAWRKCLEKFSDLRGNDYRHKKKLEEVYQKDLGYKTHE